MKLKGIMLLVFLALTGCKAGQPVLLANGESTICVVSKTSDSVVSPVNCFGRDHREEFSSPIQDIDISGSLVYKTVGEGEELDRAEDFINRLSGDYISDIATTDSRLCVVVHEGGKDYPGRLECFPKSQAAGLPELPDIKQVKLVRDGVCVATDTDVICGGKSNYVRLFGDSESRKISKIDSNAFNLCALYTDKEPGQLECFDVSYDFPTFNWKVSAQQNLPVENNVKDFIRMENSFRFCWVKLDGTADCNFISEKFSEHEQNYVTFYAPRHTDMACAESTQGITCLPTGYGRNGEFAEEYHLTNLRFTKDYAFCGISSNQRVVCRQSGYGEFEDIPASLGEAIRY